MRKVYVGNLEWSITDEQLAEFFGEVATVVSAKVIKDHETNKSRGFGFVEFTTQADAKKAIEKLDGIAFNKRNIIVKEARPEKPRY